MTSALTMRRFTGTKSLRAVPMTRGEYNAYRGWTLPEDEDPADPGYLVEYEDGGKPNDGRHAGYISWSPAGVFERSYQPSETPLDRLRIEKAELDARLEKLRAFVSGSAHAKLATDAQYRLEKQLEAMQALSKILAARLANDFTQEA